MNLLTTPLTKRHYTVTATLDRWKSVRRRGKSADSRIIEASFVSIRLSCFARPGIQKSPYVDTIRAAFILSIEGHTCVISLPFKSSSSKKIAVFIIDPGIFEGSVLLENIIPGDLFLCRISGA